MEQCYFYFLFDGNFQDLSFQEFLHLFSALDKTIVYTILFQGFDILIIKTETNFLDTVKVLQKYSRFSSLTREIGIFYFICEFNETDLFYSIYNCILQQINENSFNLKIPHQSTFKVEMTKRGIINEVIFSAENRQRLIFSIADELISLFNLKVDLKNEEITISLVVLPHRVILGQKLFKPNRKEIMNRTPSNRSYFHSGSMNPILIRSMINLGLKNSYVPKNKTLENRYVFLDPFMGAGGILMEAGTMGFSAIGIELSYWMSRGARMNLSDLDYSGYNSSFWSIIRCDSNLIPLKSNSIDFIVTDPPYGHSTILGGQSLEELLKNVLRECFRVLKIESRMVISVPSHINPDFNNFKILEQISDRVHSSLTRIIYLLEK